MYDLPFRHSEPFIKTVFFECSDGEQEQSDKLGQKIGGSHGWILATKRVLATAARKTLGRNELVASVRRPPDVIFAG
jgi:hypothetical protein